VSTAEAEDPAWAPTDPTEADTCPGCGATHGVQRITGTSPTVDAAMCTACGLHGATTTVSPALSILGLLPTPQLRTAAFLALLRTEVTRRSRKGRPMTVTVCLPATEVISIDAMASVDTALWWCPALRPPRHYDHPTHGTLRGHRAPGRRAPCHDSQGNRSSAATFHKITDSGQIGYFGYRVSRARVITAPTQARGGPLGAGQRYAGPARVQQHGELASCPGPVRHGA
jgi:hypothetical protein